MLPDLEELRAGLQTLLDVDVPRGSMRIVRAPGRVNLIGEHTDYNEGFVLPVAIGLETWIASVEARAAPSTVVSAASGERVTFDVHETSSPSGRWTDYLEGVAAELRAERAGLRNVNAYLTSSLPSGAGLSSSAALELAAAWTLSAGVPPRLDPLDLARAAQRAENDYVGVRCGIMDQAAVALGRRDAAILLDCRSLAHREVSLPLADHALVVLDSGSPRRLAASDYNARRAECEAAVRSLAEYEPDVRSLRDVTSRMLERHGAALDDAHRRRAQHVVGENQRVLDFVAALERADLKTCGRLLHESHRSLADLFEVSSPELDTLVAIAMSVDGVLGSRLTGAGFGGSTITLVRRDRVAPLRWAIDDEYPRRTGLQATVYVVDAVDGAGLVPASGR